MFKKRWINFVFLILIGVEIYWFSSIPGSGIETGGISLMPIAYHFIVFFLFALFLFSTINHNKKIKPKLVIFILILSLLYAVLDEIHQIFVPGRSSNLKDVLTDSAGIFSSTLLYLYINKTNQESL